MHVTLIASDNQYIITTWHFIDVGYIRLTISRNRSDLMEKRTGVWLEKRRSNTANVGLVLTDEFEFLTNGKLNSLNLDLCFTSGRL